MFKGGVCSNGDLRPVPQRTDESNTVCIWSNETEERKPVLIFKSLQAFWSTLLGLDAFQEQLSATLQE